MGGLAGPSRNPDNKRANLREESQTRTSHYATIRAQATHCARTSAAILAPGFRFGLRSSSHIRLPLMALTHKANDGMIGKRVEEYIKMYREADEPAMGPPMKKKRRGRPRNRPGSNDRRLMKMQG